MNTSVNRKALLWSTVLLAAAVCFFIFSRYRNGSEGAADRPRPSLSVEPFETGYGWGYRIFANDTSLVIEQDVIPAMPGKQGFSSREKALKTGNMVREKLEKGQFPPAVTREELTRLGVIP